jgi:hypothetical protein
MDRATVQPLDLVGPKAGERSGLPNSPPIHHPCLALERYWPYSALGGEQFMNRSAIDELKQQIPLLDYLRAQGWQPSRSIRNDRLMGLCPLHTDHSPSFLVDPVETCFTAMAAHAAVM